MLRIEDLQVGYGGDPVIDGLEWSGGDPDALVTALLGPSGCGKSTLIRTIAGLETPRRGRIIFDGNDISKVPTHRRDFGVVFQDGQLFGGRSVAANIAYGLRMRRWSRGDIDSRVAEMLELVRLPDLGQRRVEQLSGGQAQRVALARALAPRPRLLLLDEPLAALDRRLRDSLAIEIAEIVRAAKTPTIVVTHDHGEAATMADSIAVMHDGQIVQTDRPRQLWSAPADEWTARFLGATSVLAAHRRTESVADTDLGPVDLAVSDNGALLALRAESVLAEPSQAGGAPAADDAETIEGTVTMVADLPAGPRLRVRTDPPGAAEAREVDAVAQTAMSVGQRVSLRLVAQRVAVIGAQG